MKKVLITGSNGFLGSNIINNLSEEIEVYGLNYNDNSDSSRNYRCDITNYEEVNRIIELVRPDTIIHLAAIVHKNNSDTSETNYNLINYEATKNIADIASKYNVAKFIFASTIEVYGDTKEIIVNEQTTCNPKSFYAKSKYKAEKYLLEKKFSFNTYILRFTPLYSDEFSLNVDKRLFLIKNKIGYYFKKGDYTFTLCSVENACNFINCIIDKDFNPGLYLLSDELNYSAKELLNIYKEAEKLKLTLKLPYYITYLTLLTIEKTIKIFRKKDVFFSASNFKKLFYSKVYDSSKARVVCDNLNSDFREVILKKNES